MVHPDRRVYEAIRLVSTVLYSGACVRHSNGSADHDVELPANPIQGTGLVWKIPSQSDLRYLVQPLLCWRICLARLSDATTRLVDGRFELRHTPAEECRVFVRDHHVGYIDWATYEENRRMVRRQRHS